MNRLRRQRFFFETSYKSLWNPRTESVFNQILEVSIPIASAALLLMACGNAVASGVLLFEGLEQVFRQVAEDVATQYTKPTIDYYAEETLKTYAMILPPMVSVLFWHQVVVIVNQAILILSITCQSIFLKHFSMAIMTGLTAYELIIHLSWTHENRIAEYKKVLPTLTQLTPLYLGANSTNLATLVFNYIQSNFQCCGVYTYTEWLDPALKWSRKIDYGLHEYDLRLPISCCSKISLKTPPICALPCATEKPFQQGCVDYFSTMPLFRITWIPEERYALVYLILHIILIVMYLMNVVLEARSRKQFMRPGFQRQLLTVDDMINGSDEIYSEKR